MSNQNSAITTSFLKCSQCGLGKLCLPLGLDYQDMNELENIIEASSPYKDNQPVYRADQKFERIFAVDGGTCCRSKISRFYLDTF